MFRYDWSTYGYVDIGVGWGYPSKKETKIPSHFRVKYFLGKIFYKPCAMQYGIIQAMRYALWDYTSHALCIMGLYKPCAMHYGIIQAMRYASWDYMD